MIFSGEKRLEVIVEVSNYYVENKATIRQTAEHFGLSKSWIHFVIKKELPKIDYKLYEKVNSVIIVNKEERALRGGIANARSYERECRNGNRKKVKVL